MKLKGWVKKQREEERELDGSPFRAFINPSPSSEDTDIAEVLVLPASEHPSHFLRFCLHSTHDDILQMGGTEDNGPDSKGVLYLSHFLYLEGAIT